MAITEKLWDPLNPKAIKGKNFSLRLSIRAMTAYSMMSNLCQCMMQVSKYMKNIKYNK